MWLTSSYEFEWDSSKDAPNQKKHGISFDEAKTVFTDEYARLIADPYHSADEDRFIILGSSLRLGYWLFAIAFAMVSVSV